MAVELVDLDVLGTQGLVARGQGTEGRHDVHAHEVRDGEVRVLLADDHRETGLDAHDGLARDERDGHEAAGVLIAGERGVEELGVDVALVHGHAHRVGEVSEQVHPVVDIGGAVVAVHHGNGVADRGGHEVDLLGGGVLQGVLEHDHREDRGARADVAGALGDGVRRDHAGAGVALRRAQRAAGLEVARGVEQARALIGKVPGDVAGHEHTGKKVLDLPLDALARHELVELGDLCGVVVEHHGVDGEHAGGVADGKDLLAGQAPVHEAGQGGEEVDVGDVLLAVKDGLVDVADAPALGRVERKEARELVSGLGRRGVAPGAERHEELAVGVEGQVAVHHGRDAEGADLL